MVEGNCVGCDGDGGSWWLKSSDGGRVAKFSDVRRSGVYWGRTFEKLEVSK